jgi:hypothetical protein
MGLFTGPKLGRRQAQGHGAALAVLTLPGQLAAQALHDVARHGQAQAQASKSRTAVQALEHAEQLVGVLRPKAGAVVCR